MVREEPVEVGNPVHAKQYGFAIQDELLCADTMRGLDDQRITACPIVTLAGEQPDAIAIA
jgi:hypothetical protein